MSATDPAFIKDLNFLITKEVSRFQLGTLQDTDWTVERMMDEHRLSKEQARKVLNGLASQGHFEKIRVPNPNGGGARTAYRPVEKKKP